MPLTPGETSFLAVEGFLIDPRNLRRRIMNCFAYRALDPVGGGQAAGLVNVFKSIVWAAISSRLHNTYAGFQTWESRPCNSQAAIRSAWGAPRDGQKAGDALPVHQCVNVGILTAKRGRRFLGLKRFSPLAESTVTGDQVAPGELSAWGATLGRIAQVLTDEFGVRWQPCVYSRLLSQTVAGIYTPWLEDVTSCRLNKTLGVVRHRRLTTER